MLRRLSENLCCSFCSQSISYASVDTRPDLSEDFSKWLPMFAALTEEQVEVPILQPLARGRCNALFSSCALVYAESIQIIAVRRRVRIKHQACREFRPLLGRENPEPVGVSIQQWRCRLYRCR